MLVGLPDVCPRATSGKIHLVPEPVLPCSSGDVVVAVSSRGIHGGHVPVLSAGMHLCTSQDVAHHGLPFLGPMHLVVSGFHANHSSG